MSRYAPRDEISEKALARLVSLGSRDAIAKALSSGLDEVIPSDLQPSARAYVDPRTGNLYSRRSVQEAKSFYEGPLAGRFRTIREVTNETVARERVLDDAGFTFAARDWSARHERDLKVRAIERAYRAKHRDETVGSIWAGGSPFRAALSRLSDPLPPGTKEWESRTAQEKKTKALEALGLRPPGFKPLTGAYTPAELAAAWRRAGRRPPQLSFKYRKTR